MATNAQVSLAGATFIDVNTMYTQNTLPDRVPDALCIQAGSLFNLFNCPIGARSRIGEPEYGSMWYQFLQEPVDDITSGNMRIAMIQAIQRWEPRIQLDLSNTYIIPDVTLPGYRVRISGTEIISQSVIVIDFDEVVGNGN